MIWSTKKKILLFCWWSFYFDLRATVTVIFSGSTDLNWNLYWGKVKSQGLLFKGSLYFKVAFKILLMLQGVNR